MYLRFHINTLHIYSLTSFFSAVAAFSNKKGDIKIQQRWRQQGLQESNRFIRKTTTQHEQHTILLHSFAVTSRPRRKMTDFPFNRGRKNVQRRKFLSFSELGYGSKEFNSRIQETSPTFDKCIKKSFQIFAMEIKRTRIHFLSDVYCAVSICFVR